MTTQCHYRFTHLVAGDYAKVPARPRMNVMAKPGVDKEDFELWSLAVSAVNGYRLVNGNLTFSQEKAGQRAFKLLEPRPHPERGRPAAAIVA